MSWVTADDVIALHALVTQKAAESMVSGIDLL